MYMLGSGGGSVGRGVASDTRDLWFKSQQRENFIYQLYNKKDETKKKQAGTGPSEKKNVHFRTLDAISSLSPLTI